MDDSRQPPRRRLENAPPLLAAGRHLKRNLCRLLEASRARWRGRRSLRATLKGTIVGAIPTGPGFRLVLVAILPHRVLLSVELRF